MNEDQRRAFFAVAISAVILFGWQYLFVEPQVKKTQQNQVAQTNTQTQMGTTANEQTGQSETSVKPQTTEKIQKRVPLKNFTVANGEHSFVLNSELTIQDYNGKGPVHKFKDIVGEEYSFQLQAKQNGDYRPLRFEVIQITPSSFNATAAGGSFVHVDGKLTEEGRLLLTVSANAEKNLRMVFKTNQSESSGFAYTGSRQFLVNKNEVERFDVGDEENGEGAVKWLGLDYKHHLYGILFPSKKVSRYQSLIKTRVNELDQTIEDGVFVFEFNDSFTKFDMEWFFTIKEYDRLTTMGHNLKSSIDFGFFAFFAVPILRTLQFFYGLIPNYGLSIIFVTLIIRLLLFPLAYKSFKSMKKMQVLQPEMAKLKEKFKDDPQRMQKETMELFKRSGANPLSGCLPLIAQMPIFFAFYKVLYEAVELVGAPFIFWIQDLSSKDPYYVVPLLMTAAMFLQQKLTPTASADPMQKKIMYIMPIVFGFIMKDLPSGLTLYILISTLFGIAQQLFVYKRT